MKKLTKSQRVYLALLIVAIVAFTVDTLFLRGEGRVQQASAEALTPAIEPLSPPPVEPILTVEAAPIGAGDFVEALKACESVDIAEVREAFVPSEEWLKALAPPPPPPPDSGGPDVAVVPGEPTPPDAQEEALAILRARQFAKTHNLMSIIRTSDGGTALVDGQVVQVGRKLDGFTLVELTERGAVFEADGKQIELRLSED